jgi:hypothetical protein
LLPTTKLTPPIASFQHGAQSNIFIHAVPTSPIMLVLANLNNVQDRIKYFILPFFLIDIAKLKIKLVSVM